MEARKFNDDAVANLDIEAESFVNEQKSDEKTLYLRKEYGGYYS